MNRRRHPIRRVPLALAGALALVALLTFVAIRPPLPSLPHSFSEPLAVWQVEEVLLFLAWLAVVALLLLVVALVARTILQRSPPQVPLALRRDADREPKHGGALLGARVRPNPLSRPYVLTVATPQPERHPEPVAGEDAAPAATVDQPQLDERPRQQQQRAVAIRMLGPPAIEGLPRRGRGLRTDCRLFLLYLALHPNGASRDEIVAALWPDVAERRARQRLYQAAADARSRLGDAFVAEGDRYRLEREQLTIDVDELERLLREADGAREGPRERAALEQAVRLVRGQPLAGLDVPSMDGEARRLTAVVVGLCERVAHARLGDGDPAGALAAAERGITFDELNEDLWRLALEAESVLGLRDAVVSRYETLSGLLGDRLGLEPDRETRALYLELLGQG